MRATTAFSRLLRLPGVWVKKVRFQPDRVIVEVALWCCLLQCPRCEYTTAARKDTRNVDSVWRHLDLGVWRLFIVRSNARLGPPLALPTISSDRIRSCAARPERARPHAGWLSTP